jgi:hypothetical protein
VRLEKARIPPGGLLEGGPGFLEAPEDVEGDALEGRGAGIVPIQGRCLPERLEGLFLAAEHVEQPLPEAQAGARILGTELGELAVGLLSLVPAFETREALRQERKDDDPMGGGQGLLFGLPAEDDFALFREARLEVFPGRPRLLGRGHREERREEDQKASLFTM